MGYTASMRLLLALILVLPGCTTIFLEYEGECVQQQWAFASVVLRRRMICDLPPPTAEEGALRDREAMDTNPFPELFERNEADSTDPNLLEKTMGYPQDDGGKAETSH